MHDLMINLILVDNLKWPVYLASSVDFIILTNSVSAHSKHPHGKKGKNRWREFEDKYIDIAHRGKQSLMPKHSLLEPLTQLRCCNTIIIICLKSHAAMSSFSKNWSTIPPLRHPVAIASKPILLFCVFHRRIRNSRTQRSNRRDSRYISA